MGKQTPFAFNVKFFTVGKQITAYFSVFSLCFSPTGIISWLPILWGWHSYPFSSWLPSTSSSTPPSGYFLSEARPLSSLMSLSRSPGQRTRRRRIVRNGIARLLHFSSFSSLSLASATLSGWPSSNYYILVVCSWNTWLYDCNANAMRRGSRLLQI